MARTQNSGGDTLARGGARYTFRQPAVTEEKYNEATQEFDLERFLKGEKTTREVGKKEVTKSR